MTQRFIAPQFKERVGKYLINCLWLSSADGNSYGTSPLRNISPGELVMLIVLSNKPCLGNNRETFCLVLFCKTNPCHPVSSDFNNDPADLIE